MEAQDNDFNMFSKFANFIYNARVRWTLEEDTLLRKHYPKGSVEELMEALPGRTYKAIQSRASKLGVRWAGNQVWEDYEVKTLTERFFELDIKTLRGYIFGKSKEVILLMAEKLGLIEANSIYGKWKKAAEKASKTANSARDYAMSKVKGFFNRKRELPRLTQGLLGRA